MPDQKLSIQIETTATGAGVQQTAAGVQQVAAAAKQAAPAVGSVSSAAGQLANAADSASVGTEQLGRILGGIARSRNGGAEAIMGVANAARTLFQVFMAGTGVGGMITTLVALVGGLALAFRDTGEDAEKAKKKIEGINQLNLDSAKEQQRLYGETIQANLTKLQAEYDALEKIADVELNRRKTAIDVQVRDGKISERQGEAAKRALDRQREDEKRSSALRLEGEKLGTLEEAEIATAEAAAKATDEWLRQTQVLKDLAAAQKEVDQAAIKNAALGGQQGSAGEYATAKKRLREAEIAAKGIDESTAANRRAIAAAEAEAADKAEAAARAQREKYTTARRTEDALQPKIDETRRNEDRAAAPQTEAEKAAIEKARAKQDERVRRIPAAIWANRIASGDTSVDIEALRRNYPAYKFATPAAAPSAPLTPTDLPAKPSADTKQLRDSAEKINDGMTKAAEQEVPDLKPAAEAAGELVKKGEELATSLQQTGDSMVQAFGQVAEQQGGIVEVQGNQQAQIAKLLQKVREHDSAIATLRQRSQAA